MPIISSNVVSAVPASLAKQEAGEVMHGQTEQKKCQISKASTPKAEATHQIQAGKSAKDKASSE